MSRHGASATPATKVLDAAGIAYELHAYEHDPRSESFGVEAADKLGIDRARVFKTLVVDVDGDLVVGIVPVTGRLDVKALAATVGGKRAALADSRLAQRRTGYVIGGISPIGQRTKLPTVLDESADAYGTILVSGGRRGLDIELAPSDLAAVTGATRAQIARSSAAN